MQYETNRIYGFMFEPYCRRRLDFFHPYPSLVPVWIQPTEAYRRNSLVYDKTVAYKAVFIQDTARVNNRLGYSGKMAFQARSERANKNWIAYRFDHIDAI